MCGTIQNLTSRASSKFEVRHLTALLATGLLLGLSACGNSPESDGVAESEWAPAPTGLDELPTRTADFSPKKNQPESEIELISAETSAGARPLKGSAEWLLMEIAHLRNAPVDLVKSPIAGRPGEFEEVRLTPEQTQAEQIRRYEKTVELAMQAISKTHQAEGADQLFNNAVHYLSDARLQLVLNGQQEHAQLLDENAEALFARDSTSFAAIDAASHMIELTHTLAERNGHEDQQWVLAFAKQARLFAERFPQETSRAAVNVIAAGRMCEQTGLDQEAEACLSVIEQIAPNSPYSEQVSGSLRRLRLTGSQLVDFGGSTFDGGFTSIDQFRGTNVLIAFWASNSDEFRNDLPKIQSLLTRSRGKLVAVGVNMDRDETAVERFIKETGINWKHVFYSDPEKRGARNVVARHYGIINVPEYWLVDAQGLVRSINLDTSNLEQEISTALSKNP